jgi:hypothetical protein
MHPHMVLLTNIVTYVVCSKSIEPYFFPRKPMKRGMLSSVEMWRGH